MATFSFVLSYMPSMNSNMTAAMLAPMTRAI